MRARSDPPAAIATLVLANVAAFAWELRTPDPATVDGWALIPYDVTHDLALAPPAPPTPLVTLVSTQFLHASWSHLLGNLVVLGLTGPAVERALGSGRFLAFYLICGTLGSLADVVTAPDSQIPVVGASGAIAGVLGGYLVLFPLARVGPLGLFAPALFIGAWILLQFEHGFAPVAAASQAGGIAYFAHIGGFLAGVIAIAAFARTR